MLIKIKFFKSKNLKFFKNLYYLKIFFNFKI